MKFCTKCGTKLEAEDKFCKTCGEKVAEEVKTNEPVVNTQPNTKKTDGFAIAGFVLSLVSTICCGYTSFVGLIFSIIGLTRVNKSGDEGKGLAIAGIIISSIFFVLMIILSIFGYAASFFDAVENDFDTMAIIIG